MDHLYKGIKSGDRKALARAITLAESENSKHREIIETLLEKFPKKLGTQRIGVTGAPGVGKSHFIETLSLHALAKDKKVAILAIDPSSPKSGGSILGDKTRMSGLITQPNCYIRPSPSNLRLGGTTRYTQDIISLIEAANFDIIIIETVGVGQSEVTIKDSVDHVCLLLQPMSGDDLQAIKKGIMEICDLLIINKADGSLEKPAHKLSLACQKILGQTIPVFTASSKKNEGFENIWAYLNENISQHRRQQQIKNFLRQEIKTYWIDQLESHEKSILEMEQKIQKEGLHPSKAAREIVQAIGQKIPSPKTPFISDNYNKKKL